MLIKKLRESGKAEEVAAGLADMGGAYNDGTHRFKQNVIFLQKRLRGQPSVKRQEQKENGK